MADIIAQISRNRTTFFNCLEKAMNASGNGMKKWLIEPTVRLWQKRNDGHQVAKALTGDISNLSENKKMLSISWVPKYENLQLKKTIDL